MHDPLTKAWCDKHQIPQSVRYLVWSIYDLSGESNSDPDPALDMLPNEYITLKHLDGTFIEIHHLDELRLVKALQLIGTHDGTPSWVECFMQDRIGEMVEKIITLRRRKDFECVNLSEWQKLAIQAIIDAEPMTKGEWTV